LCPLKREGAKKEIKEKKNITLESEKIICKLELEKGRVTKMVTSYELS
jgi:hypothetical protein